MLDGELTIPVEGALSFDELQMRLHPAASRVRKLAAEHPAVLVLFDLPMAPGGKALLDAVACRRRRGARALLGGGRTRPRLRLSPMTLDRAQAEKRLARRRRRRPRRRGGQAAGRTLRARASATMLKVKRIRTADCVVGGFRYGTDSRLVGSLLLGLYDEEGLLQPCRLHLGDPATRASRR